MCLKLSVRSLATCTWRRTLTDLWPRSFLPVKGAGDRESGMRRNMPRRCCPPSHPAHPPFQNHLDHRERVNHIRGPEERWEVDSTVTAGVALARLIPLGRGKRGTPSRLRGRERKKHFPRNEFTCMVTQRSWPGWCLLEETITLGTNFFFFSCWAPPHCHGTKSVADSGIAWAPLSCHGEAAPLNPVLSVSQTVRRWGGVL